MRDAELRQHLETEIKRSHPTLYREFQAAAALLQPKLDYEEYLAWAREAIVMARGAYPAAEAAAEYCRASTALLRQLRFVQFAHWARLGRSLSQLSAALALSYYRASRTILGTIAIEEFELWANAGRRLFKDSWRGQMLAARFLESAPDLFQLLSLDEVIALGALLEHLARHSPDGAEQCLGQAVSLLARVEKRDRLSLLRLAAVIAERDGKAGRHVLEAAPATLAHLSPSQRPLFMSLVETCAHRSTERAMGLFLEGSAVLGAVDPAAVTQLLAWSGEIATLSPSAGVDFLSVAPELLSKLGRGPLERWLRHGVALLVDNHEAGLAYFRLQSRRAREVLRELSHVCELEGVRQVLRMYCQGLTGREVQVLPTADLIRKGFGWTAVEQATSDGSSIFLPLAVESFDSYDANFAFLKVLATHQAGHLEFGTYEFSFDRPSALFDDRRPVLAECARDLPAIADLERFFDLFEDRRLAKQTFAVLEDGRVDALVREEYAGIRQAYGEAQRRAVAHRGYPFLLPLRSACLELLLRLSLGDGGAMRVPGPLARLIGELAATARLVWAPRATVEDAAEATIRIYDLLRAVPNVRLPSAFLAGTLSLDEVLADQGGGTAGDMLPPELSGLGSAGDEEMAPEEGVDYRGEMKPELVQALAKVRGEREGGQGTPLSPEELRRLLEKNGEVEIGGLSKGEIDESLGLFVNNLLGERGKKADQAKRRKGRQRREKPTAEVPDSDEGSANSVEVATFSYDEWDFRAGDYRTQWCHLSERRLKEGDAGFYQETLHKHRVLAASVRRQFERLRPEHFKKVKRLPDGEDLDLDALIEAAIDRRSGHTPSEKIYWRRNKVQRDVAVAFLFDMSASTDEEIEEVKRPNPWDENVPRVRGMRIIDLERESLVLLTEALQAIGDRYGVFGFSSFGRGRCEFYVVKDFDEDFGEPVKRRIERVTPMRGTRMGVAIRHAAAKLEQEDCRLRILVLLSDGYPQDHDYHGGERSERDYALQDTRMALSEAKGKHILPFCLTVDKTGHDYLKTMCADIGYEIVNDVASLPRRLPALYRLLTR